jgi:hypothetical protein
MSESHTLFAVMPNQLLVYSYVWLFIALLVVEIDLDGARDRSHPG